MKPKQKVVAPDLSVISMADIDAIAERAKLALVNVRNMMLNPGSIKKSPMFTSGKLMSLCGLERHQFDYRHNLGTLPQGTPKGPGRAREYTLEEVRQWIAAVGKYPVRTVGQRACTIAVSNFKGGTGKTSTSMSLAQGLTLRGLKVLLVDLDPQGSVTTLNGYIPDVEITENDTVERLCDGVTFELTSSVRPTYWDGLYLIPARTNLYNAEFMLPARQRIEPHFRFWDVISSGLDSVRDEFDVIILDNSPSLSYLTLNALVAADVLLIPVLPETLDYASMAQFWNLFSDISMSIQQHDHFNKSFDALHILLSKVDEVHTAAPIVRRWLAETYAGMLLPVEIPDSTVVSGAAAEFGTVYDIGKYNGDARTYARIRDCYDRVVDLLMPSIMKTWTRTGLESVAQSTEIKGGKS